LIGRRRNLCARGRALQQRDVLPRPGRRAGVSLLRLADIDDADAIGGAPKQPLREIRVDLLCHH
jgi:hypothetical protein